MKQTIKITSILTITCVICSFALTLVFQSAKEVIAKNAQKDIQSAIEKLAPLAKKVEKMNISNSDIYLLKDKNDKNIGYALIAQGQGYQGKIKILSIISTDLEQLHGIEILSSLETPGLGSKIKDEPFKSQFISLSILNPIEGSKTKTKNKVQTITGATISSKAVINILNKEIKKVRKKLKE